MWKRCFPLVSETSQHASRSCLCPGLDPPPSPQACLFVKLQHQALPLPAAPDCASWRVPSLSISDVVSLPISASFLPRGSALPNQPSIPKPRLPSETALHPRDALLSQPACRQPAQPPGPSHLPPPPRSLHFPFIPIAFWTSVRTYHIFMHTWTRFGQQQELYLSRVYVLYWAQHVTLMHWLSWSCFLGQWLCFLLFMAKSLYLGLLTFDPYYNQSFALGYI